jgi:hypothetical protein
VLLMVLLSDGLTCQRVMSEVTVVALGPGPSSRNTYLVKGLKIV